ncbi:MAG: lipocalin family protein [Proteobacteria bacterium]|nr:lipocalin family protein [Pseudomonadota bacterium]
MRPLVALFLALAMVTPALGKAPEPSKPVDPARFSGRWYEFARLPNPNQRDCQAPTYDWSRGSAGELAIALTCRAGSPTGKASVRRARAAVIPGSNNAKLRVSFLGGVVKVEYRILDHAPDYTWVLMGTEGGNYLWALSTRPNPPQSVRDAAIARAKALGYPTARFEFPRQAG